MAGAADPERHRGRQKRMVWVYLPALAVLALFLYVVPYGFVQMHDIHSGLIAEFEDVSGFETIDSDVNWYPISSGGSVTLRPLAEQSSREVRAHAADLGYQVSAIDRARSDRARTDSYDGDTVTIGQNPDGTVSVDVSVFDTDLTVSWPIILMLSTVIFFIAWGFGKYAEARIRQKRSLR